MKRVSGVGSLSQGKFTASVTCPEMTFVDYYLWRTVFFWFKWQGLLSSYNWYHFSSVVVGVSWSLIVSPNALLQLHLRRSVVIICRTARTYLHGHELPNMKLTICYTLPLYLAVPLDTFSHTAVSAAYLLYGGTNLSDSLHLTLTVGWERESVLCASHRTSAHFDRLVQPTRPTGVKGRRGWGESTSCWWW